MQWLEQFVTHCTGELTEEVRESFWSRGASDEQIDLYQLGYFNRKLPIEIDFPSAFLEWSKDGAKLADVYVLPLTNTIGTIKGLQFRHVDRERKGYMDYFADKSEPVFFGLAQAMPHVWATRSVYLVEGAFDLFPIQRIHPSIFATLTARVTDPLVRVLHRLVDEIWMGYDNDNTGQKATGKFVENHALKFKRVWPVVYPRLLMSNGEFTKDPSELWEIWGDPKFQAYLKTVFRKSEPFYAQDL